MAQSRGPDVGSVSEMVLWRTEQVEWVGNSPGAPDLALIRVEIIFPLGLAIGDAADPTAIAPGGTVVIAEEAEDPIPLQRPVATHDEPTLPWLPLFLWERVSQRDTLRGAQKKGRGNPPPLKWEDISGPLQFCSCLLKAPEGTHKQPLPELRSSFAE